MHSPRRWRDLPGRRIAIWGLGANCEAFLHRYRRDDSASALEVLDATPPPLELRRRLQAAHGPLNFVAVEDIAEALAAAEILVKTPGVSLYHPTLLAARRGNPDLDVCSVGGLQLAEPEFRAKAVAITGTKGKTTIASLTHHCLRKLGVDASLGGNTGALPSQLPASSQRHILEMPSFWIAEMSPELMPPIALLSNLHPAHIQWHGSVERYYADKLRLFESPACARKWFNAACANTRAEIRRLGIADGEWYMNEAGFHVDADGRIMRQARTLDAPRTAALAGEHNRHNLCAALTLCEALGHEAEQVLAAAEDYVPPPHRHQYLGRRGELHYIDNSIATVPEATLEALQRCAERGASAVTLLIGGAAQNRNLRAFARALKRIERLRLVLMPDAAEDMIEALDAVQAPWRRSADLAEALHIAREITPPEGVVLLSPAAPTGAGHFANYIERGVAFRREAGFENTAAPAENPF